MSIRAMNWAWDQRLGPSAKLILLALADDADDSGQCWPAVRRIAGKCLVSERTVQRALKEFETTGLLATTPRFTDKGRQTSNVYKLVMTPHPDKMSPSPAKSRTRGDTSVTLGATQLCRGEGDTAVAPLEPPREALSEPPQQPVDAQSTELLLPRSLPLAQNREIARMLEGTSPADAQVLLDELEGALETPGTIKTTAARWFRALVRRQKAGQFAPSAGIHITARRDANQVSAILINQDRRIATVPSSDLRQRLEAIRRRALAPDP